MHVGLVICQEGVSSSTYIFLVCSGRQTFVHTSFTKGIIRVPHCVSTMNTHGSWKVTVLCFALECTRLIIWYVDTCRCTIARLLICEGRIVILFYTVSNLNTHGALKLTLLWINHEYTSLSKVDLTVLQSWRHRGWCQYVFQLEHTST